MVERVVVPVLRIDEGAWLYASDDVIRAINNMVDFVKGTYDGSVKPDPILGHKLVGDVVLAMRKDLLRRTSLTDKAFEYTDVHEDSQQKR